MNTGRDVLRIVTEEDFSHCVLHRLEEQINKQSNPEKVRYIYDMLSEGIFLGYQK